MDPMFWLGHGGLFASAMLPGVMLVVFVETGLLFPFLPGDTLLFSAGLIAAQPDAPVDIWLLAPCAAVAAIAGGQVGFVIGRRLGPKLFTADSRFFKQRYLESSRDFFARHGRKTIVIGHFIGAVRTFTPVIAGASGMRYRVFLAYDVVGAVGWGVGLTVLGYHLGAVPLVSANLEFAVLVIATVSTLPVAASLLRGYLGRRRARATAPTSPSPSRSPASTSPVGHPDSGIRR